MNFRYTLHLFSMLMIGLAVGELLMALFSVVEWLVGHSNETHAIAALSISGGIGLLFGFCGYTFTRGSRMHFGRREALLLVGLSWLIGAALGGLPYFLWSHFAIAEAHPFHSPIDCYFESMSGLTTTGSTVLSDIPVLPRSILLWRSTTHWLGGLGIVVLFVAVLPQLGVGGKRLFKIEAPGPTQEGVRPHIRETARLLWLIYLGMTIAEVLLLWLAGMGLFDSVCHTFGTLATGGFSTRNASIGAWHGNVWIDVIVIVFMLLAGVNFALYPHLLRGRWRLSFKDTELRVYLLSLLGLTVLIGVTLWLAGRPIVLTTGESVGAGWFESLRQSAFQVVSIHTTTGFCTADFNTWPFITKALLVAAMFVGGSAGSTGGGIKVVRIWTALKLMAAEIELSFRPNVVRTLRIGRQVIDQEMKQATLGFVLGAILLFGAGGIAVMFIEQFNPAHACSYITAATAVSATLFNIGPGLEGVGAIENYGDFTWASKVLMSVLMAIGRLEIFAIAVLLSPQFWSRD